MSTTTRSTMDTCSTPRPLTGPSSSTGKAVYCVLHPALHAVTMNEDVVYNFVSFALLTDVAKIVVVFSFIKPPFVMFIPRFWGNLLLPSLRWLHLVLVDGSA